MTRRAVFLDRDGVINAAIVRDGRPYPPGRVEELAILPGVAGALDDLRRAGFVLLVVTNQPDVARGTQTREAVEAIHARLRAQLPLDAIYTCYHDDADRCACRKPAPGLVLDGAREFAVELTASFLVGDRWRDIAAGAAAGCRTVFVDHGYRERQPPAFDGRSPEMAAGDGLAGGAGGKAPRGYDMRVTSLAEAAAWILAGATT